MPALTLLQSIYPKFVERRSCRCFLGLSSYLDWIHLHLHSSLGAVINGAHSGWSISVGDRLYRSYCELLTSA